jgi:hypothetical protein
MRAPSHFESKVFGWSITLAFVVAAIGPALASDAPPAPSAETCPDTPPLVRPYRLYAAAELGLLMPVGSGAMLALPNDDRLRWDIDFTWEPSNYLQSYSLGGAYHPWDRALFVGARARFMQLHPPFSRGFHARRDNQLAFGPELGVRFAIGRENRFVPFASVGAIFFPSETSSLPPMYTLDLGLAFGVLLDR